MLIEEPVHVLQKIDGKLAVMGNTHTSGDEMGKAC
jgi:hypothetical protein